MKVKFFCAKYIKPTESAYQHNIIALAEGFSELKILFFGNIDYWFEIESNEFLIKKCPIGFKADIHIYSSEYFNQSTSNQIDKRKDVINILVDSEDGEFTSCHKPLFRKFHLILRSHYNKYISYPNNVTPWAFGLTNRIIQSINLQKKKCKQKTNCILNNFRVHHDLRSFLTQKVIEMLDNKLDVQNLITSELNNDIDDNNPSYLSYWAQTGRRHNVEYYKSLCEYQFTLAFGGGLLLKPIGKDLYSKSLRQFNKIRARIVLAKSDTKFHRYYTNFQFDSWRFWEAAYAGSIPIHLDFEAFGLILPEMPINGHTYLGIKNLDLTDFQEKIINLTKNDINIIETKAINWVRNHYSPQPTSKRLLQSISELV